MRDTNQIAISDSVSSRALRAIRQDKITLFCAIFTFLLGLLCAFAPFITPFDYDAQNLSLGASSPSFEHIFGTDILGRDMFTRMLYGGRISFAVGLLATFVAAGIGVLYGVISGMAGGKVDAVMMRCVDIAYSLPFTIFVILLTVAFGRSIWLIFIAIGAVEWLTMARIVRACTLDIKGRAYVEAAKSLGESNIGIVVRHILPNAMASILVCAALTVPSVMLLEAFLSFLGLGVQAPLPSWGSLIKDGAEFMEDAPWLLIFPAVFFSFTLYSLNRIGETLSRGGGR